MSERSGTRVSRKKPLIPILLLLAILTVGVAFYFLKFNPTTQKEPTSETGRIVSGRPGSIPGSSGEATKPNNVGLKINSRPVFANGREKGSLMIENPATNKYDMKVAIYLGKDSSGELIYQSDIIPPGYFIDYDQLSKELAKGTHKAVAYLTFYEGERQGNSASINLDIVVKN